MAKTTMIGNFKMAGELSDANMAVRLACTLIHEAEERGELISRGDLIEKICTEYSVFDSNYGWLGTPGPKSPIGTLYDRVKGPKGTYVMKMLPLGMPLVGTAMNGHDFARVKRQEHWRSKGVYDVVHTGELYNVNFYDGKFTPATVTGESRLGFTIISGQGPRTDLSIIQVHHIECEDVDCSKSRSTFINECLRKKTNLKGLEE